MSKDEKFEFDIENLKRDLAIENMNVTDEDIELLKKYLKKEITVSEIINQIKNSIIYEV